MNEKRILVPIRFNDINKHSMQYADAWAQRTGAKLYFFHALNISDRFYSEEIENIFETRNEEVLRDLTKQTDQLIQELEIQSSYECIFRTGKPYQLIIDLQEELDADLIIMASHEHTMTERKMIGKNTDYVLHYAKCPVYVYKEHTRTFSNKIVVPLGDISSYRVSDTERNLVKIADEWALRRGSEIYFMHATRLTERFHLPDIEQLFDSKMGTEEAYDNLSNKLKEFVGEFSVKSPHECIIRDGKPHLAILDQQQALNAKLILLSAKSDRSTLQRFFVGSTSDYILHNSKCPIYLYKG